MSNLIHGRLVIEIAADIDTVVKSGKSVFDAVCIVLEHDRCHADAMMNQAQDLIIERTILAGNKPEDGSALPEAFDFLLNRFPRTMDIHPKGPWKTPKGMMVVEEWGQADKKTKKALAKLVKKHKRIKKGKRK